MKVALSRAEAAESASVSEDVIDAAIKTGALKAKKQGRRVLVRPADLESYVDALDDVTPKADAS